MKTFRKSSFVNYFPPDNVYRMSPIRGIRYVTSDATGLIVTYKSPRILMLPSCFRTGKISEPKPRT